LKGFALSNKILPFLVVSSIKLDNAAPSLHQQKRLRAEMAPATIDMEIRLAHIMLNRAYNNNKVSWEVMKPFKIIKRLLSTGANARKTVIPYPDYLKLIGAAQSFLRPLIIVGYNTGMRAGEIMGLKWSHIERKTGFIRLTANDTKEGKEKVIPINRHVSKVLDDIIPILRSEYIFHRKGKRLYRLPPYFTTACKRAGLPYGRKQEGGYTFHDLRRSVKTNMLEAGVDKVYRDTLLGHGLTGMDVHYLQPSEDNLKTAMQNYTNWLDEQHHKLQNVDQTVDQK
jgi:integrase